MKTTKHFPETSMFASASIRWKGFIFLAAIALLVQVTQASAADGTWTASANGSWITSGNWNNSVVPGGSSGTTNVDTATFNTSTGVTVTLDATRNLKNVIFDTNAGSFTFSGGSLVLTAAGNTQITSALAGSNITESINSAITLEGSYTFANNSATSSDIFNIGGNITNAAAATITLTGTNGGNNIISGTISPTTGTLALTKTGAGKWILTALNSYTGATTVSAGTLGLSGTGAVGSSAVAVSAGALLAIDSSGVTPPASVTRAASITLNGGALTVAGSSAGATNDVITGALTLGGNIFSTITINPNNSTAAKLTSGTLTRNAGGIGFFNGTNLGLDGSSTSNVGRVIFTNAPAFVGSATDGGTSAGTTKNLGIYPYLVGEFGATGGSVTGTANTFLTYNATTGLRPLDLINEYVNNPGTAATAAGNNVRITSNTSISGTNINSLVVSGGNLTISSGTIANASGGMLLTTSNTISGGTLSFADTEGIIIVNGGGITPTISSALNVNLGGVNGAKPVTINVGAGSTLTLSGGLSEINQASGSGGANFTITGGGTVVLSGASIFSTQYNGNGYSFAVTGNTVLSIIGTASIANATISVNPGSVMDVNGGNLTNAPGLNGGGGVIKLSNGTITMGSGSGYSTTDTITGGKGLIIGASSVAQTLSGSDNYAGGTTVSTAGNGTASSILKISGGNALSDTGVVTLMDTASANTSTLDLNGSSETIGTLLSGTSGTGLNANDIVNNTSATSGTLTINTSVAGSGTFAGIIKNTGGASSLALTKTGINTETLSGLNTYGGRTAVNNGTLLLDLSTNTTGVLASTSLLTLGGGTLNVQGASSGASSQTLGNLTLTGSTGSNLVLNSNGGSGTTLTLGNTWTRGAGSTLFVDLSSNASNILASNPSAQLTNSVISYAVVKDSTGTGFATITGGNIVRYTGATSGLPTSGAVSTTNYSTSGAVALVASEAVNSLAIDASGAGSLDLGANELDLTSGGLLMTGSNNYTIQNGQLGASGAELIIQQYGTGALTISGTVSGGAGSLTKAGTGTLLLTGSNNYTGATNLNGGVVNFSNLNNFGNGGAINFGGGTLQYATGNTADITTRLVSLAGAGGTVDTNGNNVTFANGVSGVGGLTKAGNGTLTLSGSNSYTGDTAVNGGTLLLDLATNTTGVINSTSALLLGGGTLDVKGKSTGASSQTLGGLAVKAGGSSVVVDNNGGAGTTLTINGLWSRTAGATVNFDLSSSANNVLQTQTVSNSNGIIGGWLVITDATGTGFATYADVAANLTNPVVRYTGASNLVASSNSSTTNFTTSGSAITLNAAAHTTNSLAIDTSAGSGSMNLSGTVISFTSGGLLMTGGNNYTISNGQVGANNVELIVQQYGAGTLTISGTVSGGTGSLTKAGSGTLSLTGNSSYTGATNVNGGKLLINGNNSSATGAVNVNSGASLGGTGTIGGAVTVAGGASMDLRDGATGTLTLGNGLTIGAGGPSSLYFDLGTSAGSTDLINVTSGGITLSGSGVLNFTALGTLNAGNYTLITSNSAFAGTGAFSLASSTIVVSGTTYNLSLANSTSTSEILTVSLASLTTPSVAYWQGAFGASGTGAWNTVTSGSTNFTSDAAGTTNTAVIPGSTTNVKFTANSGSNVNTVLGQDFTINSLEFTGTSTTAASTSVTIGGTSTLTILSGTDGGNAAGNGITVDAGSAAHTISANVALGASQTWTVNGNALTVSGNISSGTNAYSLTKSGTGTLVLSGSDTYSGATIVNSGMLKVDGSLSNTSGVTLGNSAALSGTGTINAAVSLGGNNTVASAGTLTVASLAVTGTNNTISSGAVTASGGTTVTGSTGNNASLKVNGTLNGGVTAGATGSGKATVGGSGTINGGITVSSGGVLAPGDATITTSGGSVAINNGGGAAFAIANSRTTTGANKVTAGTDYDQVALTSGNLTFSGSTALTLNIATGAAGSLAANAASAGNPYIGLSNSTPGVNTNTTFDNYFVFRLSGGTTTGQLTTLTLVDANGDTLTGTILYGTGEGSRFADTGIGDVVIGDGTTTFDGISNYQQEFAISYTGDYATNSTTGGRDVVMTAIPEAGTWGMTLLGFGMLIGIRRCRKRFAGQKH